MNLTAVQLEPPSTVAIDRLLIEPVAAAGAVEPTDRLFIDLGSGGGSPAIPLKIAAPHLALLMVEAKSRKAAFLREAVRHLELENVEVANERFENLRDREDVQEAADIVAVRAVRADRDMWALVKSFLIPGGRVFWFAGDSVRFLEIEPPLRFESRSRLIPGTQNQLTILRKRSEGR